MLKGTSEVYTEEQLLVDRPTQRSLNLNFPMTSRHADR